MLSALFTRRLKGGIEKQGSGFSRLAHGATLVVVPPQLWGKVGMGVCTQLSSPPSLPSPVAGGRSKSEHQPLENWSSQLITRRAKVIPIITVPDADQEQTLYEVRKKIYPRAVS